MDVNTILYWPINPSVWFFPAAFVAGMVFGPFVQGWRLFAVAIGSAWIGLTGFALLSFPADVWGPTKIGMPFGLFGFFVFLATGGGGALGGWVGNWIRKKRGMGDSDSIESQKLEDGDQNRDD